MSDYIKHNLLRVNLSFDEKMKALSLIYKRGYSKPEVERKLRLYPGTYDKIISDEDINSFLFLQKIISENAMINSSFQEKKNDVSEAELKEWDWSKIRYEDVKDEAFKRPDINYITGLSRQYHKVRGIRK